MSMRRKAKDSHAEGTVSRGLVAKVVRGEPLPELTDAEAEALGAVTPAERDDAAAMWRSDAPPDARTLLDAPEYEGEDGG